MHTVISIEEARNLYPSATKAISYTAFNGSKIVVFEVSNIIVQVNDFGYRKEAFTQPRVELLDELFPFLMEEDDSKMLKEASC